MVRHYHGSRLPHIQNSAHVYACQLPFGCSLQLALKKKERNVSVHDLNVSASNTVRKGCERAS